MNSLNSYKFVRNDMRIEILLMKDLSHLIHLVGTLHIGLKLMRIQELLFAHVIDSTLVEPIYWHYPLI